MTDSMLIASQQKYKFLRHSNIRFNPKIGSNEIEVHNEAKYLGVQIVEKLKLRKHTKVVLAKLSRAVGFLEHFK